MSGVIVQSKDSGNTNTGSGAALATSFNTNMGAGNAIVVMMCSSNDNGPSLVPTCTDSASNTYTLAVNIADTSGSGDERFYIFYCLSPTPLTTSQVINTWIATDYCEAIIMEVSGLTGFLGANGTYVTSINASNTGLSTGSLAAGASTSFIVAGSMNTLGNGSAPFYPTVGTGLTLGANWFNYALATPPNSKSATWGYGNFSARGTTPVNFTSSVNSTADSYVTFGAAFSTSGGAPTVTLNLTGSSGALAYGLAPSNSGLLVSGKSLAATSGLALVLGAPVPDLNGRAFAAGPGISPDYNRLFQPLRLSTSPPASSSPNITVTLAGVAVASALGAESLAMNPGFTGYLVSVAPGTVNYGSSQSQSFGVQGLLLGAAAGPLSVLRTLSVTGAALSIQGGVMVYTLNLIGASMTATAGVLTPTEFSFMPQDVDALQSATAYFT